MPIKNSPKCGANLLSPLSSLLSPLSSPTSYSRPAAPLFLSLSLSSLLSPPRHRSTPSHIRTSLPLSSLSPLSTCSSRTSLPLSSLSLLSPRAPAALSLSSLLSPPSQNFTETSRNRQPTHPITGEIGPSAASSIQRPPTSFLSYKKPSSPPHSSFSDPKICPKIAPPPPAEQPTFASSRQPPLLPPANSTYAQTPPQIRKFEPELLSSCRRTPLLLPANSSPPTDELHQPLLPPANSSPAPDEHSLCGMFIIHVGRMLACPV